MELLARAVRATEGSDALVGTEQSLGGEDFAWYLGKVPGALARLGVAPPGQPLEQRLTSTRASSTPTSGPSRSVRGYWSPRRSSPLVR